jgi:hypothetical protein
MRLAPQARLKVSSKVLGIFRTQASVPPWLHKDTLAMISSACTCANRRSRTTTFLTLYRRHQRLIAIRFDARAQVTILACLEHGTDLRTWPASARAFLAPTETLTIRLQYTMGATHCEVKVPKFPFLAVSPGYRPTRIPEQGHLTLPCSPDGKLTVWAIEWIGAWLQSICNSKNDGPLDIPIPDTSMGWAAALELRVTAIELGLSQYITHIEDAWLAKAISMQMMCDDGPLIFETAREEHVEGGYDKTDRLLVALCNRHKEGLWEWDFTLEDKRMWYETFTDEERSVVRDVGRSGRSIRQTRTFSDI